MADKIEKKNDNSIIITSTVTETVDISQLSQQSDSLQNTIDILQGKLDAINAEIQQAADLGVAGAVNAISNKNKLGGGVIKNG